MEKIQEIKTYIKKEILSKKNVSKKQIEKAISLLNTIKNNEDVKEIYNNLMGKILMKQSKYLEAKNYFQEELLINPTSNSAHFHLYKISVFENNYEEAINHLLFCKNNETLNIGTDLPLTILQMIIDLNNNLDKFLNTNYKVTPNSYFSYNNLDKTNARNLYSKIINNFNNKNYQELKLNLIELDKIVKENNIQIEINTLSYLIDILINTLEEKINKAKLEYEQKKLYNANYENLLIKSFELNIIPLKEFINTIDKLIDINFNLANNLLKYITTNYNLDKYKIEITY